MFGKYDISQYTPYSQDKNDVNNCHTDIYSDFKFHKNVQLVLINHKNYYYDMF
jgi:hypothetical protein